MKTRRKFLTVGSLFATIVFISTIAASANAGEYKLAMCKDKKLCNYVLKILNEDLKAAGTIRYNEHPEFLKLEKIDNRLVNQKYPQNDECFFNELCVADINGNNKNDCIVRLSACLKGGISHNIFVYEQNESFPCSDEKTFINRTPALEIHETGSFYYLKELPKVPVPGMPGVISHYSVGGHFIINLLRYEGKTFLALTDSGYDLKQGEWYVVAEVTSDFQIKDKCYFRYKK